MSDAEAVAESLLDTLAGVLRTLGEHAFDVGDVDGAAAQRDFEAWARHALVGAPPPGHEDDGPGGVDRDWSGLRRFVSDHRRSESESVRSSLRDLRETLWIFIQGMGVALPVDRAADDRVSEQLESLRTVIEGGDTRAIRETAAVAIEQIEGATRERRERDRRQVEAVAAHVDRLAGELMQARETFVFDGLTGLYDREALDEVLERLVHLALLSGRVSTLSWVDVDDFKWLNDRYGNDAGDTVLQEVARCLSRGFNRRGDFVARAGADELAVVAQTDSAEVDEALGEHVLQSVRDLEIPFGDELIRVSVSMGVVRLAPGETAPEWIARAEATLQAARDAGRDRMMLDPGS